MQELKLKILQCGNGVSINEVMEDIEKLVEEERERIIKEVKESGLHLGYKNDIISIVNNE
jgi:hypothetical protein